MGTSFPAENVSSSCTYAYDQLMTLVWLTNLCYFFIQAVTGAGVEFETPKDNEIYERLLRRKGRGLALYIPEPNIRLPIAYRVRGIRIGDVGIVTSDGGFSFLFNICVPHNDPIHPDVLPEGFSPLQPPLTDVDVVEFPRFKPGSYLASALIEKKESESNTKCVIHNSNIS
jgi:hypothetical protein